MANNKSAKKRIKLAEKNNLKNRYYKTAFSTMLKRLINSVEKYNNDPSSVDIQGIILLDKSCQSKIDKAVQKKIFHKNTGARRKVQLTKLMYDIRKLEYLTNK